MKEEEERTHSYVHLLRFWALKCPAVRNLKIPSTPHFASYGQKENGPKEERICNWE